MVKKKINDLTIAAVNIIAKFANELLAQTVLTPFIARSRVKSWVQIQPVRVIYQSNKHIYIHAHTKHWYACYNYGSTAAQKVKDGLLINYSLLYL
jgi:hypothetical protein